jgi:hypothetical protein
VFDTHWCRPPPHLIAHRPGLFRSGFIWSYVPNPTLEKKKKWQRSSAVVALFSSYARADQSSGWAQLIVGSIVGCLQFIFPFIPRPL